MVRLVILRFTVFIKEKGGIYIIFKRYIRRFFWKGNFLDGRRVLVFVEGFVYVLDGLFLYRFLGSLYSGEGIGGCFYVVLCLFINCVLFYSRIIKELWYWGLVFKRILLEICFKIVISKKI